MEELTQGQIETFIKLTSVIEEKVENTALIILGMYFELDHTQRGHNVVQELTQVEATETNPDIDYDMAFVSIYWSKVMNGGNHYSSHIVFPTDYLTMTYKEWYPLAKERILKEKAIHETKAREVKVESDKQNKETRRKLYNELSTEFKD